MSDEEKRTRKEAVVTFSKVLTLAFALAALRYVTKSFSYGSWCHGQNWNVAPPLELINPLTPNDPHRGRTAPLTSKRCILYIYSTNIGTEYFKHLIYSPFISSSKCSLFRNSNVSGSCIIHILYTGVLKLKKKNPSPKG